MQRKIKIIILLFIIMSPPAFGDSKIKSPNVSGMFYDAAPKQLSAQIDRFMTQAKVEPQERPQAIVIAPHAGYVYSGAVAAYGFKSVSHHKYTTIVILAPSHYFGFDGIAVWQEGGFQTPLGIVEVDQVFAKKLISANEKFYFEPRAFEQEHSLEVEIPFLQKTFQDFKIVAVIMGQPAFSTLKDFARSLNEMIGDRNDVLVVVSTDLSHYHDDATARKMDQKTIETIKALRAEELWRGCRLREEMEMCGFVPVTAALLYAKEKGLDHVEVLHYANSGDVSGDKDRVVGYTSIVISKGGQQKSDAALTLSQKKKLMDIAKQTIKTYVQTGKVLEVQETDPRLLQEDGAFVTIHKSGRLRGCIGHILGRGPLYRTVRDAAIASATQDPRFTAVTKEELDQLDVEVSVLSKPRVIQDVGEIQLGVHGVIVSRGEKHQGLFLPQVADGTGWTKEVFLSQLCAQKAGLPADAWKDPQTKIEIFTAEVFSEKDVP